METINIKSKVSDQRESKKENIYNLSQEITNRLLEKYKPKVPYNKEIIISERYKKVVAY
tara:strand:+ start:168 stop:344 length:177 start_codon:yes stop_codon:yes gene_type:complete